MGPDGPGPSNRFTTMRVHCLVSLRCNTFVHHRWPAVSAAGFAYAQPRSVITDLLAVIAAPYGSCHEEPQVRSNHACAVPTAEPRTDAGTAPVGAAGIDGALFSVFAATTPGAVGAAPPPAGELGATVLVPLPNTADSETRDVDELLRDSLDSVVGASGALCAADSTGDPLVVDAVVLAEIRGDAPVATAEAVEAAELVGALAFSSLPPQGTNRHTKNASRRTVSTRTPRALVSMSALACCRSHRYER